jgi:hypothetical protein
MALVLFKWLLLSPAHVKNPILAHFSPDHFSTFGKNLEKSQAPKSYNERLE